MTKERQYWADIAKGIGIILVMLGHSPIGGTIATYTYVFNMPGFFFLAGFFFKTDKFKTYFEFFKSRVKSILLPYTWISLISMVFYFFFYGMAVKDFNTYFKMITAFIVATRTTIFYNIPLWFLPTLFFMENAWYWIRRINKKSISLLLVTILSGIAIIKFDALFAPKWFWTIDVGLFYLIFFALGNYSKQYEIFEKIKSRIVFVSLLLISMALNTLIFTKPLFYQKLLGQYTMQNFKLFYFISFIVLAMAGIYMIIGISQIIKRNRVFEYLGKNSIIFFAFHVPIFWVWDISIKKIPFFNTHLFLLSIVYTILTILVLIPINTLIQNKYPWIIGKSKKPV